MSLNVIKCYELFNMKIGQQLANAPYETILKFAHVNLLCSMSKGDYKTKTTKQNMPKAILGNKKRAKIRKDIFPRGVLSQMVAFIVHRLSNQQDSEATEFACSYTNKRTLSCLPIFISGEAMLIGLDFTMP